MAVSGVTDDVSAFPDSGSFKVSNLICNGPQLRPLLTRYRSKLRFDFQIFFKFVLTRARQCTFGQRCNVSTVSFLGRYLLNPSDRKNLRVSPFVFTYIFRRA